MSPRPVVAYALLLVAFCNLRAISTEAATATTTDTPTVVWSTAPTTTPSISAKVREYKTWGDIVVVCVMSLATMAVFMTIYELGRRQRGLRDIFDRKRETRPGRTPPRLLTGSYVWGKGNYFHRWFEFFFVDGYVDEEYVKYVRRIQQGGGNKGKNRDDNGCLGDGIISGGSSLVVSNTEEKKEEIVLPPCDRDVTERLPRTNDGSKGVGAGDGGMNEDMPMIKSDKKGGEGNDGEKRYTKEGKVTGFGVGGNVAEDAKNGEGKGSSSNHGDFDADPERGAEELFSEYLSLDNGKAIQSPRDEEPSPSSLEGGSYKYPGKRERIKEVLFRSRFRFFWIRRGCVVESLWSSLRRQRPPRASIISSDDVDDVEKNPW